MNNDNVPDKFDILLFLSIGFFIGVFVCLCVYFGQYAL